MDNLARFFIGKGEVHDKPFSDAWKEKEPYIASKSLTDAVNTALYLSRPLLLEGDPGCGKTRLAYAVAYELGYPLYTCYLRSTSRAQDLLYDYDALGRLYDIQEGKTARELIQALERPTSKAIERPTKAALSRQKYVTLGELGEAIKQSQNDIPSVVLIDEIDKADIDFPNDLLLELDRLQFQVKEVPEMKFDALKGKTRKERRDFLPLIIITSNREKELPKPFLRRCLYYYIEFPDRNILREILRSHFQPKLTTLFEVAVKQFWELRGVLKSWDKIPGTSEFLDWVRMLERDEQINKVTAKELENTRPVNLPHLETLVKTLRDRDALKNLRIKNG
ncbi:AAA family ATPase [Scytonema sp. UIC 10036]|uniref:AAA family ATPase n=1 Tax=Scytonema sp. UIC 10036 TaxID=2304196 RepID=UPI0012DA56FF|nr:MoxR family ATPase [Scytonema sp. UIC 10036]MUG94939.1 AAA family ATPase [Scytonema sp. UIC 10036]